MTDSSPSFRECPDCHGRRRPCATCNGRRIIEGEPRDDAERARVGIALAVERDGLGAVYNRLRDANPD